MKKLIKKSMALAIAAVMMGTALVACGGNSNGGAGTTAEAGAQLSEEDYKAKVQELSADIEAKGNEAMADIDTSNPEATIEATKDMIGLVKPMYEELGALNAPESFKDQHEKIKAGTDASIEMLNVSLELLEMATDSTLTESDAQEKATELTGKMQEFATIAAEMQTAINEVTAE